ncbi:UNVERIFIED_CONTAM: hypothetical protein HDU68_009532 [Siphonaria sp. JEL0065]|nr:hypothetical protein HDU68_009532 [Siphonaria sp. JEL0065]
MRFIVAAAVGFSSVLALTNGCSNPGEICTSTTPEQNPAVDWPAFCQQVQNGMNFCQLGINNCACVSTKATTKTLTYSGKSKTTAFTQTTTTTTTTTRGPTTTTTSTNNATATTTTTTTTTPQTTTTTTTTTKNTTATTTTTTTTTGTTTAGETGKACSIGTKCSSLTPWQNPAVNWDKYCQQIQNGKDFCQLGINNCGCVAA